VADNDNDSFASTSQQLQPMADQKTADSLALMFRDDGYRRQCDCGYEAARRLNPHPAEHYMTDDAAFQYGHERDKRVLICAQLIHQTGLVRTSKGCYVNCPNRGALIDASSIFNSNADAMVGR